MGLDWIGVSGGAGGDVVTEPPVTAEEQARGRQVI